MSCPISAGTAPSLTPELAEVVDVYNMLAHPLISQVSALQDIVVSNFVAPKTHEGLVYFLRMLISYHEVNSDFYGNKPQDVNAPSEPPKMHAISKGR
jgi:hypothetical protein